MAHHCPALLINCMDPRLQGANAEKIAAAAGFKPGDFEQLSYPGPSLWMADPHLDDDTYQFWWTCENVSEKVHQIHTVVLVGHSECGGFALKNGPMTPEQEREVITASLKQAVEQIQTARPTLKVIPVFVTIQHTEPESQLPPINCEVLS